MLNTVMPGLSRSKNGVASLAYVPGIPIMLALCLATRDGRDKPGHDGWGAHYFPGSVGDQSLIGEVFS
jgi:hypothetical protein